MPFGPIIPSDISFVKKKQETTLEKASSVQSRRKSRNQVLLNILKNNPKKSQMCECFSC